MSKRLIPMVARATRTIVRPAAPVAQAAAIRSFSFAAAWPLDGACRKPAAAAVAKFAHQVNAAGRTSRGKQGGEARPSGAGEANDMHAVAAAFANRVAAVRGWRARP